jgi:hypothetical protein
MERELTSSLIDKLTETIKTLNDAEGILKILQERHGINGVKIEEIERIRYSIGSMITYFERH